MTCCPIIVKKLQTNIEKKFGDVKKLMPNLDKIKPVLTLG